MFVSRRGHAHNSYNMCTHGLPDMYTLSPWACGPWALGVHIKQTTHAHVTTITCSYVDNHLATCVMVRNILIIAS